MPLGNQGHFFVSAYFTNLVGFEILRGLFCCCLGIMMPFKEQVKSWRLLLS